MIANCPQCGSRKFRVLKPTTFSQKVGEFLGSFQLRCTECGCKYNKEWGVVDWLYAKCPRCLRTDLTFWSEQYYRAPFGVAVKLALGARRLRCEACRHNFASFRKLKSKYKRPWEREQEVKEEVKLPTEAVRD